MFAPTLDHRPHLLVSVLPTDFEFLSQTFGRIAEFTGAPLAELERSRVEWAGSTGVVLEPVRTEAARRFDPRVLKPLD